jgi:branched-chain amino acid transport system substrate-binding protein
VAIISENTDFCQGFRQAVKTSVAPGTVVAFDEVVDPGTKDYRTLLTRLKSVDFDVLFANGQSDATVAEMAKQMRELGMTQQIVGGDGADSNTLGQIAKEAVEGMKVLSMPTLDESVPAAKKYGDIFRQRYDEPKQSLYWSSLAYEAVKVVADGLQSENGGSLKDWLYQMPERAGLAGTFHFDDNGDVVGMPFGIKEFRSGKLVQSDIVMP